MRRPCASPQRDPDDTGESPIHPRTSGRADPAPAGPRTLGRPRGVRPPGRGQEYDMTESSLAAPAAASPAVDRVDERRGLSADPPPNATRWMQTVAEETSSTRQDDIQTPPDRDDAEIVGDEEPHVRRPLGAGLLLLLALIWLAAKMWTTHSSIVGRDITADVAIASLALNLPDVVAASVLAGAAAGLVATARMWRRSVPERPADDLPTPPSRVPRSLRRALTGLTAGLLP